MIELCCFEGLTKKATLLSRSIAARYTQITGCSAVMERGQAGIMVSFIIFNQSNQNVAHLLITE